MKLLRSILIIPALVISLSAGAQSQDVSATESTSPDYYTNMSYNIGMAMGETADFISATSFRGATLTMGHFINDNISVDLRFSWNTFYEAMDPQVFTVELDGESADIYGKQFRYINAFPITVGARYVLNRDKDFSPYFAAGMGAYKVNRRVDMGLYTDELRKWHFGVYPQLGFFYRIAYSTGINVYARYDYALKTSNADAVGYLAFGIGFHFTQF